MSVFSRSGNSTPLSAMAYRGLSALFGLVTFSTFGAERLLTESGDRSLGDVPAYVMGGVVITVGLSAVYAGAEERGVRTGLLLASGPIGGLAAYLLGYHLVRPPSTDSPTWLVFLAFAAGFLALGVGGHTIGRVIESSG